MGIIRDRPVPARLGCSPLSLAIGGGILALMTGAGIVWIAETLSDDIALMVPLGILGGAAALALIARTRSTVFLVVLYAPVELFVQKWLPGGIGPASRYASEALLFVALGALFADRLLSGKPWKRTPLDIPLLIFVGVGVLSAIVNRVPFLVATLGLRILLRYVGLFYLVVQTDFSGKTARNLIRWILGVASLVVAVGLAQAVIGRSMTEVLYISATAVGTTTLRGGVSTGASFARGRYIFSTLGRYDALGLYAVVILLLALALYAYCPRRRRTLRWLVLSTGICLTLTMSRQSWLAMYAALWSWALLSKRKWVIGLLLILLLVPVALAGTAYLLPHLVRYYSSRELVQASVVTRALEIFSPKYLEVSAYSGGRLFILRVVGRRILELAPLLGFGPGRFGSLTARYFQFSAGELLGLPESPIRLLNDVNWMTILGQYGLIGTLAFLMMFLALLRYAWRMHSRPSGPLARSMALTCVGSIVVLLVTGFTGPNFEQRVISMYVWLIAGLTVALARAEQHAAGIQRMDDYQQ